MEIADSVRRTRAQTPEAINREIDERTRERVREYAKKPAWEIDRRLWELDREWDIERALQANAAALTFAGTVLGLARSRLWFVVPLAVSGFLLQHAVQGWCPPVPFMRRVGFRTPQEIEEERYALKALRGDFEGTQVPRADPDQVVESVSHETVPRRG